MTAVVVDASVIMAMLLPDEQGPMADFVLSTLETSIINVPQHWPLEVANGMLSAMRRKRLTQEQWPVAATKAGVVMSGAVLHSIGAIGDLVRFSSDAGLTAYDGAYVDLAHRLRSGLLTNDRQMRIAATALNIPLLP